MLIDPEELDDLKIEAKAGWESEVPMLVTLLTAEEGRWSLWRHPVHVRGRLLHLAILLLLPALAGAIATIRFHHHEMRAALDDEGLYATDLAEALVRAGVPVLGHVGLTPQTASALGGYKLQGKDIDTARRVSEGAAALERAGCWGVVLELVPAPLARLITARIGIPTIGIGAGPECDGQVLVFHDLVGLFQGFTPTFVKRYAEAGAAIKDAIARYAGEVRSGAFPGEGQSFRMSDEVLKRLYGS